MADANTEPKNLVPNYDIEFDQYINPPQTLGPTFAPLPFMREGRPVRQDTLIMDLVGGILGPLNRTYDAVAAGNLPAGEDLLAVATLPLGTGAFAPRGSLGVSGGRPPRTPGDQPLRPPTSSELGDMPGVVVSYNNPYPEMNLPANYFDNQAELSRMIDNDYTRYQNSLIDQQWDRMASNNLKNPSTPNEIRSQIARLEDILERQVDLPMAEIVSIQESIKRLIKELPPDISQVPNITPTTPGQIVDNARVTRFRPRANDNTPTNGDN